MMEQIFFFRQDVFEYGFLIQFFMCPKLGNTVHLQ